MRICARCSVSQSFVRKAKFLRNFFNFRNGNRSYGIFDIITDYQKGIKYPIADFEITPDVAIVDPELAETMPKKLVAHTGMDAVTHAIEAYVSTANCDYTDPLALHAIKMIQRDLVGSPRETWKKRDNVHNAQCLAGMAFSNALLGIVHSMAHKTGAVFADYGAHTLSTVRPMRCICRRLSHLTQRMPQQRNVMAR